MEKEENRIKSEYNPNDFFREFTRNFHHYDLTRVSIATGSSHIIDEYVDQRQKEIVLEILKKEKIDFLLDAGMGAGRWVDFFSGISDNPVGTDTSLDMLNVFKERQGRDKYSLINCNHINLPFKSNTFDVSFCCFSLLYIKNDNEFNNAINDIIRVTKNNGVIIIIEITSDERTMTKFFVNRTQQYITNQFQANGAGLMDIYGYYFDYPVRGYQLIARSILKICGVPRNEYSNLWVYLEKKGGYTQKVFEFPSRIIIGIFYPADKLLAKKILNSLCSEKIFVFKKNCSGETLNDKVL
jgi:ubiquinone/menaquinone biosynthesis C-methylase UbiE